MFGQKTWLIPLNMNDSIVGFTETFPHRLISLKCSLYRTLNPLSVRYNEHFEQLHAATKSDEKASARARNAWFGLFTLEILAFPLLSPT